MEENEVFKKELDKIEKKMVIELKSFWGLSRYPGYSGTIVTDNKEIYQFQFYFRGIPDDPNNGGIYIKKIKVLEDQEFERITKFVKNEIIDKEYEDQIMYDLSYTLAVNYNGTTKVIENNISHGNDIGIYTIAERLLKNIIKGN